MDVYLLALFGGVLIGLASGIYLLANGRIMGISGIVGAIANLKSPGDWRERVAFIAGCLISPALFALFFDVPPVEITSNVPMLIVAGLLVGFGTRLGSGCTSGHGVCGLGRLSKRSFVSVIVFMIAAIVTVFVQNHIFG